MDLIISLAVQGVQVVLVLALAPLLLGFTRKVKARLLLRQGPPLLQPYRDLLRLIRKEVVLADNASWLFRAGPYMVFSATWVAAALVPTFATGLYFSWTADLIAITALVGSGVFVQIESPFVDILVKAEDLGGDRYELDDDGLKMIGTRSGDAIALGYAMEVVVEDVAILRRTVYGRRLRAEEPETKVRGKGLGKHGPPKGRGKKSKGGAPPKAHASHARPGKLQPSHGKAKKKGDSKRHGKKGKRR